MNITYISSFDAKDVNSYSGTGYYIPKKLEDSGDKLNFIGNLSKLNPFSQKFKKHVYKLMGENYLIERNPMVLKTWGSFINKHLNPKTQLVLGYSSQPFARLVTSKPKVFWTDATFANMVDYYPVYSNLCRESIRDGNRMEHAAIHNASLAVYSSEWAAKTAVKHYGVSESKVRVVPYGANIDVDYSYSDILARTKQKPSDICNLLFLGVEWYRKGGDIALEVARALNRQGIKTRLSVVGVDPGEEVKALDFIKCYGYISKSTKEGRNLMHMIISESHFLILPTRADCTPIVYGEMNAHGIPVITTNEGGIPSLITNGVNGFMFDKESKIEVFSDCIIELMENEKKYMELAKSSFNEYKTRLNWDVSIKKFKKILKEVI